MYAKTAIIVAIIAALMYAYDLNFLIVFSEWINAKLPIKNKVYCGIHGIP